jgi:hypothetical protein
LAHPVLHRSGPKKPPQKIPNGSEADSGPDSRLIRGTGREIKRLVVAGQGVHIASSLPTVRQRQPPSSISAKVKRKERSSLSLFPKYAGGAGAAPPPQRPF